MVKLGVTQSTYTIQNRNNHQDCGRVRTLFLRYIYYIHDWTYLPPVSMCIFPTDQNIPSDDDRFSVSVYEFVRKQIGTVRYLPIFKHIQLILNSVTYLFIEKRCRVRWKHCGGCAVGIAECDSTIHKTVPPVAGHCVFVLQIIFVASIRQRYTLQQALICSDVVIIYIIPALKCRNHTAGTIFFAKNM